MATCTIKITPILKNNSFKYTTELDDSSVSDTSSVIGNKKKPLHVKFDYIQVRSYDITLGDNPTCSAGPPVTLDWRYDEMEPISLESYEKGKSRPPRKMYQMHMVSKQRSDLLKANAGISDDEMNYVIETLRRIKKERNATRNTLCCFKIEDALESAKRKWQRYRAFES